MGARSHKNQFIDALKRFDHETASFTARTSELGDPWTPQWQPSDRTKQVTATIRPRTADQQRDFLQRSGVGPDTLAGDQ